MLQVDFSTSSTSVSDNVNAKENECSNSQLRKLQSPPLVPRKTPFLDKETQVIIASRNIGIQTNKRPNMHSKFTIYEAPNTVNAASQTENPIITRFLSFEKSPKKKISKELSDISNSTSTNFSNSSEEYRVSHLSSDLTLTTDSSEERENKKIMKEKSPLITKYHILTNPKMYIEIDKQWIAMIDLLCCRIKCTFNDVLLTLMKIRCNDTFARLGDQFGISTSQASRIFSKTISLLAHFLKTFVYCPDRESIIDNLLIAFRSSFGHVCAIVDAFETHIEKPSDPIKQALIWSDYKKGNTLKYLVSCTPDGFINFISSGYGGRISDT